MLSPLRAFVSIIPIYYSPEDVIKNANLFKRFYFFISRERGREGERETSMCSCLLHTPHWGTWPTTQACALSRNRTSSPLVYRLVLSPLSHTSWGLKIQIDPVGPCWNLRFCNYIYTKLLGGANVPVLWTMVCVATNQVIYHSSIRFSNP